jgi:hypothetical protein
VIMFHLCHLQIRACDFSAHNMVFESKMQNTLYNEYVKVNSKQPTKDA